MPELPAIFIENMKKQLGNDFPAFLKTYDEAPFRALRMRGAVRAQDALEPVPWCENAAYLPLSSAAGAGILHEAGAWYIQQPSAMIPAALMPLQEGDRVLDLCAAPGGKSTQLAQRLKGGLLVSNEIVPSRAEILSANIERMGCRNVIVTSQDPATLAKKWPGFFNRVLVDAPCSGEGMFRRHPETRQEWTPDAPQKCALRQREILSAAVDLLCGGGTLVYSTCTFNEEENEQTVAWLLSQYPALALVPFSLPGLKACEGQMHIYPHEVRGEGHFVALLKKAQEAPRAAEAPLHTKQRKTDKKAATDFLQPSLAEREAWQRFAGETLTETLSMDGIFQGCAVHLPPVVPPLAGIRVLRCGVKLGSFRGKVFVPDHALSHAAGCKKRVQLTRDEAFLYMKGETLPVDVPFTGFCAAVYQGLQLGFGKVSDGMLKNHYPKGLRKALYTDRP